MELKGEAMCESESQMIEMCDGSTKVRKPYTITKQREKWTEEEHQKFLEALKLFGRGWRQIEEHIGTKTAVQIRSHAQKFFSKVVRGTTESVEGSARPIEIPPPRPKRKPVHPYPRKSATDSKQQESSLSPKSSVPEKGTKSPTSALSYNGSDSGSSARYHLNRSLSATSCSTDVYSISRSPSENEANHLMLNSHIEEKKPLPKRQLSSCSIVENLSPMVFEVDERKTSPIKEQEMSASGGFKLFGRTLSLSNSQKEISLPTVEEDQTLKAHQGVGPEPSLDQLDTRLSLGVVSNFTPLEQYKKNYEAPKPDTPVLWWNLYQVPFQCFGSYNPSQDQLATNPFAEGKPSNKEISCTDSNEGSTSSGIDTLGGKVSEAVESSSQPLKYRIVESFSSRKGFVPYKRCIDETENTSNDRETQKIRVC